MPLDPIAYKPYADPDDFIREVTDLIWVDRAIGHIYENYEPDSIVHGEPEKGSLESGYAN